MAEAHLVTLLTDFGTSSPYVAAMKGVILRACATAQIVDLCHHVPAHDVLAGAFILGQAAPYFPPETLHVVVVDPGVGTDRAILAGRFGGQTFCFPDNGVITLIAEAMPLEEIACVQEAAGIAASQEPAGSALPAAAPQGVSPTFHGRDIFAPLAGRLLNGQPIGELGPPPQTYKLLEIPRPRQVGEGIVGQVIFVDGFGNLVSNIPAGLIDERGLQAEDAEVYCGATPVGRIRLTYGSVPVGRPLAVANSMGLVEIAVNQGRACEAFSAGVGAQVRLAVARAAP